VLPYEEGREESGFPKDEDEWRRDMRKLLTTANMLFSGWNSFHPPNEEERSRLWWAIINFAVFLDFVYFLVYS